MPEYPGFVEVAIVEASADDGPIDVVATANINPWCVASIEPSDYRGVCLVALTSGEVLHVPTADAMRLMSR
jgi:hypothetical protein